VLAVAAVASSLPRALAWLESAICILGDVLEYHLQVPREWQETGKIAPLHHNVYCFFPANVEMQYLLTMHIARNAWRAMYVAQFITLGYGILSVVAIYAAARSILPSSLPPLLATAAAATVPWLPMLSSVAYNEAGMVLYIALAIAWIVHDWSSHHAPLSFALSGLDGGLACSEIYSRAIVVAVSGDPLSRRFVQSEMRRCIAVDAPSSPSPPPRFRHGSCNWALTGNLFSPRQ
jgi:hypothetical protein